MPQKVLVWSPKLSKTGQYLDWWQHGNIRCRNSSELEIGKPSSDSSRIHYIHLCANTIEFIYSHPAMG